MLWELIPENLFDAVLTAGEVTPATKPEKEFGLMVLRSGCIGALALSLMGFVLGVHVGMFWELVLPSSFGAISFGLILAAMLRIESAAER